MAVSGTKTKALCVATRCTTVDQFITTFHRFCGENQSFFVATLTSRPVGLETAFSIQLADKQPVLRGLCVVLDAWTTPANEFKRPGIRLGIKRLTADSQVVFDRLRAASAHTDATPPPGSAIEPSRAELAAASATAAMPRPDGTPTPRRTAATPPAIKRMQVALRVGTMPPPVNVADFQPAPARRISEPKLPGEGDAPPVVDGAGVADTPVAAAVDPPAAAPVDAPAPEEPRASTTPGVGVGPDAVAAIAAPLDLPAPADRSQTATEIGDLNFLDDARAPGSDFVLPANPLQHLSDESLEGFVECTLYEESGATFIGDGFVAEDPDDPLAEPPVVPVLPFDEPPRLMLQAEGDEESLRIEPLRPNAFTQLRHRDSIPASPLSAGLVNAAQQWVAETTGPYPAYPEPPAQMPLGSTHGIEREVEPFAAPSPPAPRPRIDRRWLLIGGCTVAAFAIAFTFAVLVRGGKEEPAQVAAALPPPPPVQPAKPSPPPQPAVAKAVDPAIEEEEPATAAVVGGGPCKLVIATTPAGSIIKLDDQQIGPSPLTIASTCDKHKLDISHARYQAQTKWVTLEAGKDNSIDVSLSRPIHDVMVTSQPSGAEVLIDGHRAGTTPTMVQLMGFVTVNLTVTKAGFPPVSKKLYSKVANDKLFVKLTK